MPVSVVVGGQFGSEGKGKVALEIARRSSEPVVAVRVGGPNSGHTAYGRGGGKHVLRQLPAACIDRDTDVVLPAGSYIDVDVSMSEIDRLDFPRDRIRRSSISKVIDRAESASSSADRAERSATDAKDQAFRARDEASRMRFHITLEGIIAGVVLFITIATFIYTVYSSLTSRIDDLQNRLSYIESASTDKELKSLPSVTRELEKEIETLNPKFPGRDKVRLID